MTDRSLDGLLTPRHSPVPLGGRRTSARDRWLAQNAWPRRVDWVLLLAVAALCTLGALLVWSATRQGLINEHGNPKAFLERDVLNIVIGSVLGVGATLVDYRQLRSYAPFVYAASILGLVAVLGIGVTINGAHSWIRVGGGFELQPSEFAKVALIVGMAVLLTERRDGEDAPRSSDILLVLALAAVPLGLIMLQPDFGTAMVFVFTILGALAVGGAPTRWVLGLTLAGVLAGTLILAGGFLKPYQKARLTDFATADKAHASTSAYNVHEATLAIGDGGLTGEGLFHGRQTNGQFVPEQQTDFVFTVAGEELGFLGGGLLILLMGCVLWRGLRIAARAQDMFGRVIAAGIVTWFAFQAFVNIGMTLGIMPVTGLPLPFVSYGGSAMFANLIAVGLLQNVHARSRRDGVRVALA